MSNNVCKCTYATFLVRAAGRVTCAECEQRVPAKLLARRLSQHAASPLHRLSSPDTFTIVGGPKL